MTVEEAKGFFAAVPAIREKMETLDRVGLSYIHVGQQANTLSGGEAQRVKLSKELVGAPPAAPSTSSTSRPPASTSTTSPSSSTSSTSWSSRATPSSSSSTISRSSRPPTGSSTSAPKAATAAARSSPPARRRTSSRSSGAIPARSSSRSSPAAGAHGSAAARRRRRRSRNLLCRPAMLAKVAVVANHGGNWLCAEVLPFGIAQAKRSRDLLSLTSSHISTFGETYRAKLVTLSTSAFDSYQLLVWVNFSSAFHVRSNCLKFPISLECLKIKLLLVPYLTIH